MRNKKIHLKFRHEKLASLIKDRGYNPCSFAREMYKISGKGGRQNILNWISGKHRPRIDMIFFVSKVLGVDSGIFFEVQR